MGQGGSAGGNGSDIFLPGVPERLKEIYDPPPVLWVRAMRAAFAAGKSRVVGTRHPSPYGSGVAEMLSRDLAVRRLLIVSGMARGIDSCAHRGALAARMPTAACGARASTWSIQGKQEACRGDSGHRRGDCERDADGTFPAPQNFPRATAF